MATGVPLGEETDVRCIAFYLPQFHPFDLNDRQHGPGFTEWTHVVRATPLFRGHQQPVVPGELGFYDLRLPEVRNAQADLARTYGVDGFCYWHYWSAGQRMMERPFSEVLDSGQPGLPFCLGWANHSWIHVDDPSRTIFEQRYPGADDDRAHFALLEPAFHDRRYLRVLGRPLVLLFRPLEIPDLRAFTQRWQAMAEASGLSGLYFVGQDRGSEGDDRVLLNECLDGVVEVGVVARKRHVRTRVVDRLRGGPTRVSYSALVDEAPRIVSWARRSYPSVVTNYDDTPRWGRSGIVITGVEPSLLTQQVRSALSAAEELPEGERLVFVKSWNEWGEGNYLEPDRASGRSLLEAFRAGRRAHEVARE